MPEDTETTPIAGDTGGMGANPPAPAAPPRDLRSELGKHDPFDSPEQEAYLNVLRTASALSSGFDRLFAEFKLSQPLYNVLRIVAGHREEGVPSQTIARHLITRGPDVTRLVDRLVRSGLAQRVPCPRDRRVVYVRITEAGRALLSEIRPRMDEAHRRQLQHMTTEQLDEISRLMFLARHPPAEDGGNEGPQKS